MRVPAEAPEAGCEADLFEYLVHTAATSLTAPGCAFIASSELGPDPESRVERRRRVLGYIGHLQPAQRPHVPRAELQQVGTVQQDLARGDAQPAAGVAEQGQGDGGLARARLADEPEHLAGRDVEADLVDDVGLPFPAETDLQAGHGHREPCRAVGRQAPAAPRVSCSRGRTRTSPTSGNRTSSRFPARGRPRSRRERTASVNVFVPMVSSAISSGRHDDRPRVQRQADPGSR